MSNIINVNNGKEILTMNNKTISKAGLLLKRACDFTQVNSPTIFAGIAIAGVVGTTIMAVRATMKANEVIQEATANDPDTGEVIKPEPKEVIAMTWKYYVPPVLMAGLTIGSIITSNRILNKRNVALAGLYSVSQEALKDYEKKIEETFGKGKAEKVKAEAVGETLARHPVDERNIVRTGFGNTLCYDPFSDRYFYSNIEMIRKAINDFNFALNVEVNKSLNELYEYMELNTTYLGEVVGWTADEPPELRACYRGASDGTPCLVLDFAVGPSADFRYC